MHDCWMSPLIRDFHSHHPAGLSPRVSPIYFPFISCLALLDTHYPTGMSSGRMSGLY